MSIKSCHSNPADSSLDVLGKQLPRLGGALGTSAKPNEHVMGQCDAFASIVLVHCEIAHRRIDHLKQNVFGGRVKLQQPGGGVGQPRPCLPFSNQIEGAFSRGSLSIVLTSGID